MIAGLAWVLIQAVIISAVFILTCSHVAAPPAASSRAKIRAKARQGYLAKFKERRGEKKRELQSLHGFTALPDELKLEILSYAAGKDKSARQMLCKLLHVNKYIRYMMLEASLPLLDITLIETERIYSFYNFCSRNPALTKFVQHLRISPPIEEAHFQSVEIVRWCWNLRSLACPARTLAESVFISKCGTLKHVWCRELTLLATTSGRGPEVDLAGSGLGAPFFGKLTHLRVVGHVRTAEALATRYPRLKVVSTSGAQRVGLSMAVLGEELDLEVVEYVARPE